MSSAQQRKIGVHFNDDTAVGHDDCRSTFHRVPAPSEDAARGGDAMESAIRALVRGAGAD